MRIPPSTFHLPLSTTRYPLRELSVTSVTSVANLLCLRRKEEGRRPAVGGRMRIPLSTFHIPLSTFHYPLRTQFLSGYGRRSRGVETERGSVSGCQRVENPAERILIHLNFPEPSQGTSRCCIV